MKLEQIRWGILGCGDVTEVKSGPAVMNRGDTSRVVACMRRDAAKAKNYAERHGVDRWYDDADKLLADDEVNAVYIATPPNGHRDLALKAAAAGKACYVEKPFGRNAAEAKEMVDAFAAADLPLLVAYYRRRLPRFVEAKRLIDAGELGSVTSVDYEMTRLFQPDRDHGWRADPTIAGGGLFHDLGSHLLDLLDFLLGPLGKVAGTSQGDPGDERVAMSFTHDRDIAGCARWNFAASRHADRITIDGTTGSLSMSCFGNEPIRLARGDETTEIDRPHDKQVQRYLMDDVLAHLRGERACVSTGDSALRTNVVLDTVAGGATA
ncbi:MAG: Gfo/Idh/MocA family oxidoreductase [Planctomycetota bacterium]